MKADNAPAEEKKKIKVLENIFNKEEKESKKKKKKDSKEENSDDFN